MTEAIEKSEWDDAVFREWLKRLPAPIPMFDDGVACPWCGHFHTTVVIGLNGCEGCKKGFLFGYPPWAENERPVTWANPAVKERKLAYKNLNLLPRFRPNERLKKIYRLFEKQKDSPSIKTSIAGESIH